MTQERDHRPALLAAAGLLLIALGLVSWWSGADLPLHRLLRLTGATAPRLALFSSLGGLLVMGPVALGTAIVLAWRSRKRDALWLMATIVGGRLAVEALKLIVMRPRPPRLDWLELVKSWSFPSSHSAGTMMTCVALALLFGRGRASMAAALLTALLIGWSRVALAVHWPGDVLAGWGFGLLWLGLAARFGPSGATAGMAREPRRG